MKYKIEFDNITELIDYLDLDKQGGMLNEYEHRSGKFYMTKNGRHAAKLAQEGWPIGLAEIKERLNEIEGGTEYKRDYGYDVTGDFLDIGAYLQGVPECWITEKDLPDKRTINLIVSISWNAGVSAEKIYNRGAAIVALIDLLSKKHNVNLFAVAPALYFEGDNHVGAPQIESNLTVKIPTTPIDLDQIAFVFAHPSFFRRLCTGVHEKMTGVGNVSNFTSGRIKDVKDDFKHFAGENVFIESINFQGISFKKIDAAIEFVNNLIKEINEK